MILRIDVFVHDMLTGQTVMIAAKDDVSMPYDDAENPSISADGRFVTFHSSATNIVENDTNNHFDVFVHDRDVDEDGIFDETDQISTTLVSVSSSGIQGNANSLLRRSHAISSDGRYITFFSTSTNLVQPDTNLCSSQPCNDVFVHDRLTHETHRVSDAWDDSEGNGGSDMQSISSDGKNIAFYSGATNFVQNDLNLMGDVYVSGVPYIRLRDQSLDVSEDIGMANITINLEATLG